MSLVLGVYVGLGYLFSGIYIINLVVSITHRSSIRNLSRYRVSNLRLSCSLSE